MKPDDFPIPAVEPALHQPKGERNLTLLVHGASKSGKSWLSVTAPGPRLYLDVEAASRFLPIRRVMWNPSREKPPAINPAEWDTCVVATRDWGTVEKVYQWLASGQHEFRSLIIDSISELQQRYIEAVAGRVQLTQNQWGDTFRAVGGLIRDLRDLTVHPTRPVECVVMTSMTRELDGKWRPWVQGQLQTVMPYLLDVTGYLWTENQEDEITGEMREVRRLLTRNTERFEGGERVGGRIPAVLEAPNVRKMIDMVFGEKAKEPLAVVPPPSENESESEESA